MITTPIHVTEDTERILQVLSKQTGRSIPEILDKAVEEYRRKIFFEGLNQEYAALKADPVAWAEELKERELLENTLMDGIDPNERWEDADENNDKP